MKTKIGFVIPTYPNEKRVAILPEHIGRIKNTCVVEQNFGQTMGIPDSAYLKEGCEVKTKQEIFETCDYIFSLKLIQPMDYSLIRENQTIIGWIHPSGSGACFYKTIGQEKSLRMVDLDNIHPTLFYKDKSFDIHFIPKNFIWKNSINAGIASVWHALLMMGIYPKSSTNIAVLGSGNVSQGSFSFLSKFNANIRMFYRKTMDEFKDSLAKFDIIVNGIELDNSVSHIINRADIKKLSKGCLVIDAAANTGGVIEGSHDTSISNPIYQEEGVYFYEVNNAPSLLYRKASIDVSEALTSYVFNEDCIRFNNLIKST